MFLELQKPLQKRLKTPTLQHDSQSADQVTSEASCSVKQFTNIAAEFCGSGHTSQALLS